MKDWMKDLNEEELKQLYRDDAALQEVPPELRVRVLAFIRDRKAPGTKRPAPRGWLRPALIAAAAAVVLTGAFFIVRPLFMPDGGETVAARNSVPDRELERGYAGLADDQALVVFCAGEVSVRRATAWEPLEPGGYLGRGARIRVGASSSCELQFGDRAMVRLGERTEILVEQLSTRVGRADIELFAESGSVLSKVSRLMGGETYRIKTKSAACGVRGTLFGVTVTEAEDTIVSVKEGKVYVLPAGSDFEKLYRRPAGADRKVAPWLDRLKNDAPAVSTGQELFVTRDSFAAMQKETSALQAEIERLSDLDEPSDRDAASFGAATASALSGIKAKTPAPQPLNREREMELRRLDETASLPVALLEKETPIPETDAPVGHALVKIEVITNPADAAILLSGGVAGSGRFRGIFAEGTRLDFEVRREGYEDASVTVNVTPGMRPVTVELNQLPSSSSTAESPPPTSSAVVKPSATPAPTMALPKKPGAPFILLTEFAGHEYYLYRSIVPWNNALDICAKNGGHLLTIGSVKENEAIVRAIRAANVNDDLWLGLTKQRLREWMWVTGEPVTFTNWDAGQPDNANGNQVLATIYHIPAACTWNDGPEDEFHPFIMEMEPAGGVNSKTAISRSAPNPLDFSDEFASDTLNPRWSWVRENHGNWSLQKKPGYLTITTQMGEIWQAEANAQNILLCLVAPGDFQLDTKVDFRPQSNFQQAGLIVYSNDDNYLRLDYDYANDLKMEMVNEDSGIFTNKLLPYTTKSSIFYLRIVRKGETYTGYFSEDGKNYTILTQYSRSWKVNLRVGLWAVNGAGNYSLNTASFDYFKLKYTN
jgi:regulation of enolase protein 1 (concanavalin A-like superfamily)